MTDVAESPAQRAISLARDLNTDPDDIAAALARPASGDVDDVVNSAGLTASDLVALADVFDVPIGILTGQIPIRGHLGVSMRTGALELPEVPVQALEFAEMMLRHLAVLDSWDTQPAHPLLSAPMSSSSFAKEAGRVSALRVRDGLELGEDPIPDLVGLVESLGFPVAFQSLTKNLWGINIRDQREGSPKRVIVVSTDGPWTRQRFTLAHELAHALYDDEGQVIVDDVEESDRVVELRAEAFARHLLLPADGLARFVADQGDVPVAVLVARVMVAWGVSRQTAVNAMTDDRLLTDALPQMSVDRLMTAAGLDEEWVRLSAGENDPAPSPGLVERAVEAWQDGRVALRVVAELLDVETDDVFTVLGIEQD